MVTRKITNNTHEKIRAIGTRKIILTLKTM